MAGPSILPDPETLRVVCLEAEAGGVVFVARPFPSAAACLAEGLPGLCVHLRYPLRLRRRLRSTNLLERSLEELVPVDDFYRHLDRVLDLAFVRDLVRDT